MKLQLHVFALLMAAALAQADTAGAGTLRGTVKNGTTGAPTAGVEVLLIQLQGGMEAVASAKSDAQGQFSFDHPSLGQQPMLVRAVYRGVNFHQSVPPGRDSVVVEVFEATRDASILSYPTRFVVFQPNGNSLLVGEEYAIQNNSKPPQAYFRADGSFEFEVPGRAKLQQVAAWGPSGMPVVQAAIDHGENKYAVAFAFRPGQNGVRLSYQLAYPDSRATLLLPSVYGVEHLVVLAPPSVQVKGDGLQPSGTEQGMNLYMHDALTAGKSVEVNLAGTAPPPSEAASQDAGQGGSGDTPANIQVIPGRLDPLKWPLIAGFAALFVLGAIYLMRRPIPAGIPANAAASGQTAGPRGRARPAAKHVSQPNPPPVITELDNAVNTSLDALKDALFRLELRRQAGTISEEEYSRERARAEEVLRNFVRG